jgi:large subunit ribosomal protein L15
MQIHELKPKHKNRTKKRIGRGGKKGTTSGKGQKGQSSRAGRKMVPIIRELIKKYPKLRGYRSFRVDDYTAVVNLEVLEKNSKDGETINPENLLKKGIVSNIKGKTPKVKILGTLGRSPTGEAGKLTKKLVVENCKTSKTAKEAIEKAGGSIKISV